MTINKIICDSSNYKAGRSAEILYIVMHYTANKGDTAKANGNYFANNADLKASAHYFVDETEVVQSVEDDDTAWHCGGSLQGGGGHTFHGICLNANSIGVEMCSDYKNEAYVITDDTVNNAMELVKSLMDTYSIDTDHVIRHYDVTGKNCPAPWVADESLFTAFKARLTETETKTESEEDDEVTRYEHLYDIPDTWGQRTMIDKLMTAEIINGDGSDPTGNGDKIDLSADMIRMIAFNYAAGVYDAALEAAGLSR